MTPGSETNPLRQDDGEPRSEDHEPARLAAAYVEAGASIKLARALAGLGG